MTLLIKITGKASTVFKVFALMAKEQGHKTLSEIEKQYK